MERVAQGGAVALTAIYQNGAGDLVDPATPRVDVIDAGGVELVTNATPVRVSLGNYSYTYAVPEGGAVGIWRIHWSGTVDGFDAGGDDYFNVVAPGDLIVPRSMFATPDEFGAYLGEELDGVRLAQATLALESATALIKSWTRQTIERVAFDEIVLAGTTDWELELPERPVISVTSVKVDGTLLDPSTYRLVGNTIVRRTGGWVGPTDSLVQVTYTHGFDPIPDDIRAVTLALAARGSSNPLGVSQEGIGSYSVTYGGGSSSTANSEVLSILSKYRRRTWAAPMRGPDRAILPMGDV